jgi:hypothetical protein
MARNTSGLRPWRPGQSGNPRGRPRGTRAVLDVISPATRDAILCSLADRALKGDVAAAKVLLDRTDPVLRRQEIGGIEGKPLEIQKAEAVAAELPTEVLRELDALAERIAARAGATTPERRH